MADVKLKEVDFEKMNEWTEIMASPLQYCDEDEEVFFGKPTEKELRRAQRLAKRRTVVFDANFRQRQSLLNFRSLMFDNDNSSDSCDRLSEFHIVGNGISAIRESDTSTPFDLDCVSVNSDDSPTSSTEVCSSVDLSGAVSSISVSFDNLLINGFGQERRTNQILQHQKQHDSMLDFALVSSSTCDELSDEDDSDWQTLSDTDHDESENDFKVKEFNGFEDFALASKDNESSISESDSSPDQNGDGEIRSEEFIGGDVDVEDNEDLFEQDCDFTEEKNVEAADEDEIEHFDIIDGDFGRFNKEDIDRVATDGEAYSGDSLSLIGDCASQADDVNVELMDVASSTVSGTEIESKKPVDDDFINEIESMGDNFSVTLYGRKETETVCDIERLTIDTKITPKYSALASEGENNSSLKTKSSPTIRRSLADDRSTLTPQSSMDSAIFSLCDADGEQSIDGDRAPQHGPLLNDECLSFRPMLQSTKDVINYCDGIPPLVDSAHTKAHLAGDLPEEMDNRLTYEPGNLILRTIEEAHIWDQSSSMPSLSISRLDSLLEVYESADAILEQIEKRNGDARATTLEDDFAELRLLQETKAELERKMATESRCCAAVTPTITTATTVFESSSGSSPGLVDCRQASPLKVIDLNKYPARAPRSSKTIAKNKGASSPESIYLAEITKENTRLNGIPRVPLNFRSPAQPMIFKHHVQTPTQRIKWTEPSPTENQSSPHLEKAPTRSILVKKMRGVASPDVQVTSPVHVHRPQKTRTLGRESLEQRYAKRLKQYRRELDKCKKEMEKKKMKQVCS